MPLFRPVLIGQLVNSLDRQRKKRVFSTREDKFDIMKSSGRLFRLRTIWEFIAQTGMHALSAACTPHETAMLARTALRKRGHRWLPMVAHHNNEMRERETTNPLATRARGRTDFIKGACRPLAQHQPRKGALSQSMQRRVPRTTRHLQSKRRTHHASLIMLCFCGGAAFATMIVAAACARAVRACVWLRRLLSRYYPACRVPIFSGVCTVCTVLYGMSFSTDIVTLFFFFVRKQNKLKKSITVSFRFDFYITCFDLYFRPPALAF